MDTLLDSTALIFAGDEHDVADLVLAGLLTGDWQAFEADVARGVALEVDVKHSVDAAEVERALESFRYERRLIAAADLEAWLSERSLRLDDLVGVLRRQWLRAQHGDDSLADGAWRVPIVMRAEAICSGALARSADTLRAWHAGRAAVAELGLVPAAELSWELEAVTAAVVEAAAADVASGLPALGIEELRRRTERLASLQAAYAQFRSFGVPDAEAVARVAERRIAWTIALGHELCFEREGAALETVLRVSHDGESLVTVAAGLERSPVARQIELGAVPAALAAELLAARPGELVGPWREHGGWAVFEVSHRVEPGLAGDEQALTRAREELLGELLDRYAAGKVTVVAAL